MMKRNLILVTIVGLLVAGSAFAGDSTKYGEGVTLEKAVSIEKLLASPADYLGQEVRVDGTITAMCQKRGCWMQLTNDKGNGVRIKVEDGVIVFPATSMGHTASAQGVFEGIPVAAQAKKHEGEEHEGEKHEACDSKPKGEMIYFIKGTGAVIES
ncbi:MAG: hypothetical protein DRJ61_07895 [Acidobacteria bacterium]|nr:MAG: hypothetical protein DRJ65_12800 [Acidobacteriota bacterium]RLE33139.1 MAG: hypothetical protein DRJ61_07895 [Acidobacteriota bacterium]